MYKIICIHKDIHSVYGLRNNEYISLLWDFAVQLSDNFSYYSVQNTLVSFLENFQDWVVKFLEQNIVWVFVFLKCWCWKMRFYVNC